MLDESRTTPMAAYMQVASCVPSTHPGLETTGAYIGPEGSLRLSRGDLI